MREIKRVNCPECGKVLGIKYYLEIGDTLLCDGCGAILEITEFNPPKLKLSDFFEDEGRDTEEEQDDNKKF